MHYKLDDKPNRADLNACIARLPLLGGRPARGPESLLKYCILTILSTKVAMWRRTI